MPSRNCPSRVERVECDECGSSVYRRNLPRHKQAHRNGIFFCPTCPQFKAKSQSELAFHQARRHVGHDNVPNPLLCPICQLDFNSFYGLQQHKNRVHGARRRIEMGDPVDLSAYDDDEQLKEELQSVQHFLRDHTVHAKHQTVYNFKLSDTSHESVEQYLDQVFSKLQCAAKINIAFGFVLKSIEGEGYRYYYAHHNNSVFERPVMVAK